MAELTGQTFAGFEIVAKLGEGGMGAVYKARQPLLDRFVALKVMSQQLSGDPAYVARFIREAASAAKLNHPNMVQVHTAGEQGGVYYIVMEFVEGESLNQRLKRTGPLDPSEAIAITLHVATALQRAWNEAQLIHRDIKPDNIFLSKKGEVKVGDLGLAKSVGGGATEMTQSGMMMGSPHYISPEQARGSKETDFRADIYSLGCTLYQLLSGKTPYQANEALAVVLKHVTDPVPDILAVMPHCPPALAALVAKMMAKAPDQRHASYEELIAELWQASDLLQQQQSAPTAGPTPAVASTGATLKPTVKQTVARGEKPVVRNSRFVIAGAVAVAVLLLAGLFLWSPWKEKPGSESRLQAESVPAQPAKAGTQTAASFQHSAASSAGILAPPETRVTALTTNPKVGEVYTLSLGSNVTMELMGIPPGEFMMGSTKEEQAWAMANGAQEKYVQREGLQPRRSVISRGFWLARSDVTVGQWKRFIEAAHYVTDKERVGEVPGPPASNTVSGLNWRDPRLGFELKDDHPVCYVSWNDALRFCAWLTEAEGRRGKLPPGMVYRLPTEAEWEYACRAGTQTRFWWGDSVEEGKSHVDWTDQDFVFPIDHLGPRGRNPFGLADMVGNVMQWCLDDFDWARAHDTYYTGNPESRVLRGSACGFTAGASRSAWRGLNSHPAQSNRNIGFSVAVGSDWRSRTNATTTALSSLPEKSHTLAPPETRVPTLTTAPKVGEVYTLPLGSNVTMKLMGIPPGEFMMGSTKEEQAWAVADGLKAGYEKREGEAPRKAMIKEGFWLGRTEVTVGQWKQFVKETGYVTEGEKNGESSVYQGPGKQYGLVKGKSWRDPNFGFEPQDDHPVCCVTWNDAAAYCDWLTGRERKAGRLALGSIVRLPTEAEWEYACRAGTQTTFWWGDSKADSKKRLNWYGKEDGFEFVAPVDSFGMQGRNRFGLADMLGNVYEWCLDEYDPTEAHAEVWTGNPSARSVRGGAFTVSLSHCRCAYRHNNPPAHAAATCGFRVVVGADITGDSSAASAPQQRQKK